MKEGIKFKSSGDSEVLLNSISSWGIEKTLDILWERLPLMRSKARAVNEEQRLLLDANSDVVKAAASWGESTGELNIEVRSNRGSNSRKRATCSSAPTETVGSSNHNSNNADA